MKRLLAAFLVLLGSCADTVRVMYGVPASLNGQVRVENAAGVGVPAIRVSYTKLVAEGESWAPLGAGVTDADGNLDYQLYFGKLGSFKVKLEDTDGAENGAYLPQEVLVDEDIETVVLDPAP